MAPTSGSNKGGGPGPPAPVTQLLKEPRAARTSCQMLSRDCPGGRQRRCWHLAPWRSTSSCSHPSPCPSPCSSMLQTGPFRAGFSAICLNKPLSHECKRHCEHKPPVTSPLLSDVGAVGGRLGIAHATVHTVCDIPARGV